jgi:hypothetical protein
MRAPGEDRSLEFPLPDLFTTLAIRSEREAPDAVNRLFVPTSAVRGEIKGVIRCAHERMWHDLCVSRKMSFFSGLGRFGKVRSDS